MQTKPKQKKFNHVKLIQKTHKEKKNVHAACSYALRMKRTYDEDLISSYRVKDFMQRFSKALKLRQR